MNKQIKRIIIIAMMLSVISGCGKLFKKVAKEVEKEVTTVAVAEVNETADQVVLSERVNWNDTVELKVRLMTNLPGDSMVSFYKSSELSEANRIHSGLTDKNGEITALFKLDPGIKSLTIAHGKTNLSAQSLKVSSTRLVNSVQF